MKTIINKIDFFWKGNPVGIAAIWTGALFLIYIVFDSLIKFKVI